MKKIVLALLVLCIAFSCNKEEVEDEGGNWNVYYGNVHFDTQKQIDSFAQLGYYKVIGSVTIGNRNEYNNSIVNLESLSQLLYITEHLEISGLNLLESLDGINNLKLLKGLSLRSNNSLIKVDGFNNVNVHIQSLYISGNLNLQSINGFKNTPSISSLDIRSNKNLNQIGGFTYLNWIRILYLENNDSLKNIKGLNNLKSLEDIWIGSNDSLIDLDFLRYIYSTIGLLHLQHNSALTNLNGLTNVEKIDFGIILTGSDALINIDGLKNIRQVGTGIQIGKNSLLTNIDGLFNLEIVGSISIHDNPSLSDFCVLKPVAIQSNVGLNIYGNLYNPTLEDIINDKCKL